MGRGRGTHAHLVGVPVVGLGVDAFALETGVQFRLLVDAHRAADDLADAGHEHIHLLDAKRSTDEGIVSRMGSSGPINFKDYNDGCNNLKYNLPIRAILGEHN